MARPEAAGRLFRLRAVLVAWRVAPAQRAGGFAGHGQAKVRDASCATRLWGFDGKDRVGGQSQAERIGMMMMGAHRDDLHQQAKHD